MWHASAELGSCCWRDSQIWPIWILFREILHRFSSYAVKQRCFRSNFALLGAHIADGFFRPGLLPTGTTLRPRNSPRNLKNDARFSKFYLYLILSYNV
jgi:hypothetical protein